MIIRPLSVLPTKVLYGISDILYILIYYFIGYRKQVVYTNLRCSFPDHSDEDIRRIAKKFYRHFCDLVVESIRLFGISESELRSRFSLKDQHVIDRFADEGKSVAFVAGHYNNWEMAAVIGMYLKHEAMVIYTPLGSAFFERKMLQSRMRWKPTMVPKSEVRERIQKANDELHCWVFVADQSPSSAANAYWTTFLNQDTAVQYGAEKYAREYNLPVIFGRIAKKKRGYYELSFELIHDQPTQTEPYTITESHVRLLERDILRAPEYWLWTHRRWKHQRSDR